MLTDELYVLSDVTSRLEKLGVPYMLTGSMAMHYYAEPRMTRDIDVVVAVGPGDVEALVDLFKHDYYVHADDVRDSILRKGGPDPLQTGLGTRIAFRNAA